jgi:sugar/nucleoside kinase (ribokinase family)
VDVVCLGILVADAIARPVDEPPERGTLALVEEVALRGGGCAVNTASGLVRLGLSAAVVGKIGTDALGDFLVELLDARGVDRRAVIRDAHAPTSATVALVGSDGERTFLHAPGANACLRADELDEELLFSGRALHLAGALVLDELDGEPAAGVLAEARRRGLLTSVDTVHDPAGRWDRVEPLLPHADLFAPSLAEARGITGEHEPAAAAAWLRDRGVAAVAVKLGADGCYALGDEFEGHVEGVEVEAVDGTGSGDAFVAGLLYGTLARWSFESAVRFANATGALSTTAVGAVEGIGTFEETAALAGIA